jgi:hypothetical protein
MDLFAYLFSMTVKNIISRMVTSFDSHFRLLIRFIDAQQRSQEDQATK